MINENDSLSPPWKAIPDYDRYSMGWRMGGGEDYMIRWSSWVGRQSPEDKVEYFRALAPIPYQWVDLVLLYLGYDAHWSAKRSAGLEFLATHGIDYDEEFESWYVDFWKGNVKP